MTGSRSASRGRYGLALVGAILSGALVAVQSRVNGGLSKELANGYLPALVSVGSGLIVLLGVFAGSREARAGARRLRLEVRTGRVPRWALFGGLSGAALLLGQGLTTPLLGVVLFTVGLVGGQAVGGLVLDWVGIGHAGRMQPSFARMIGGALMIVAVAVASSAGIATGQLSLMVAPLGIGVMLAWQAGANGLLRSASKSTVVATAMNFFVGAAALLPVLVVSIAIAGFPKEWPSQPLYYIGGMLGVIFVAMNSVFVRKIGILVLGMSNVAGQLLASIVLEHLLPLTDGVGLQMVLGALVALCALAVLALPAAPFLEQGQG